VDPHGHPIPRKDGTIPKRTEQSLLKLPVGVEAVVSRVSDEDPAILRYLMELEIVPGARLQLTERAPFDGPLILKVEGKGDARALGPRVAAQIHVVADGDSAADGKTGA
jgi:DtxR family Mn-dependent transcriptional regulator